MSGADTLQEALALRDQTTSVLSRGGFELRKWASNCPQILPASEVNHSVHSLHEPPSEVRNLGMLWFSDSDQFRFAYTHHREHHARITKRYILSRISTVFDSLGLLDPVVLVAKLILQRLWQLGLNWDESLSAEIHLRWTRFEAELDFVSNITVARRLSSLDNVTTFEFLWFL